MLLLQKGVASDNFEMQVKDKTESDDSKLRSDDVVQQIEVPRCSFKKRSRDDNVQQIEVPHCSFGKKRRKLIPFRSPLM